MTKLITSDSYKFGQKNVLPYVGEVEISSEGIIEVEDSSLVDKIVESEIGFTILVEQKKEKEYKNEDGTPMSEEQIEHQKLLDSLSTLKVAELKDLCKELPEVEWKTLKQKELVDYLKSKL